MRKRLHDRDKVHLEAGALVWYMRDGLVSICKVTKADPRYPLDLATLKPTSDVPQYVVYEILSCSRSYPTKYERIFRDSIYAIPAERNHLVYDLDELEDRARRYREELEDREEDYIPDPERDSL